MACKPDSTGASWFRCTLGTIGCPRIHNDLTPHCIRCYAGTCDVHDYDRPVLEQTRADYVRKEG